MKKAIVVASFGCSIKDSREKYIETIENAVKNNYKDMDFHRVFTSEIIRKKMKREEDIDVDNMKTCLEKLKSSEYTHVYVIATHILPGFEYEKITRACNEYEDCFESIKVTRPFLDDKMGSEEIDALTSYIGSSKDEATVLVGHGTHHGSHKYYREFEAKLRSVFPELYIVNIEGDPYITDIIDELKEKNYVRVNLYPFLIVAGDHALNDIASNEEDSIKTILSENGLNPNVFVTGLGADEKSIHLFLNRINEIITI